MNRTNAFSLITYVNVKDCPIRKNIVSYITMSKNIAQKIIYATKILEYNLLVTSLKIINNINPYLPYYYKRFKRMPIKVNEVFQFR